MTEVYIVLMHTGTSISRLIRWRTKKPWSHASISLDRQLTRMYSFGRYYPYFAFWGGFIKEEIDRGTFKRFANTQAAVYALPVTVAQYQALETEIAQMLTCQKHYKYNIIGLCAASLQWSVKRRHKFYCSEFIRYLLDKTGISHDLPEVTTPTDLLTLPGLTLLYCGKLRDYPAHLSFTASTF